MAAFYQKSYTMRISNNDWFRDHSSTETTPAEAGSAGSNLLTPTSPLEVAFERDTGVTIGLGLVPYLANLWLGDPFDTRIVFRIKMGIDHFSKSVIEGSMDNAFEGNSSNPIPLSRTPNFSTLSPYLLPPDDISHFSQPGGRPDEMQHPVCNDYEPFDSSYDYDFMLLKDGNNNNENNIQCTVAAGSDVSMEHADEEFEDNVSSSSSEYIYGPIIDGMDSTHLISNNNGAPLSAGAGGDHHLSATFGVGSSHNNSVDQHEYPTERFMIKCHICRNYLYKEHNDIYIFKGEYAFCNTQCREVAVGLDNFKEKVVNQALKESVAKRLENIGKFPVVFELGPSSK